MRGKSGFEEIPAFMDVGLEEQFTTQSIGDFETSNLKFSIGGEEIRGKQIQFMISYIVKKEMMDSGFAKYLLMDFVSSFTMIENIEINFVTKAAITPEMIEGKLNEMETMFQSFFKEIDAKKTRYYVEQL